jgi:hypothetical protein
MLCTRTTTQEAAVAAKETNWAIAYAPSPSMGFCKTVMSCAIYVMPNLWLYLSICQTDGFICHVCQTGGFICHVCQTIWYCYYMSMW